MALGAEAARIPREDHLYDDDVHLTLAAQRLVARELAKLLASTYDD